MVHTAEQSLRENILLKNLPDDVVVGFQRRCGWNSYAKGGVILERDSNSQGVFMITRGSVRIVNYSMTGKEISYGNIFANDYFGELSAVDGLPRSASVVATDSCVLAVLSTNDFRTLLMENPEACFHVMTRLTKIIRTCDDRIMDLSTLRAIKRVYASLLEMADLGSVDDGLYRISPMPTHAEIASQIGTTRETVARTFSELQQVGIIKRKGSAVTIMDHQALTDLMMAVDVDNGQSTVG